MDQQHNTKMAPAFSFFELLHVKSPTSRRPGPASLNLLSGLRTDPKRETGGVRLSHWIPPGHRDGFPVDLQTNLFHTSRIRIRIRKIYIQYLDVLGLVWTQKTFVGSIKRRMKNHHNGQIGRGYGILEEKIINNPHLIMTKNNQTENLEGHIETTHKKKTSKNNSRPPSPALNKTLNK